MLEFVELITYRKNSLYIFGSSLFFIETIIKQKKKN